MRWTGEWLSGPDATKDTSSRWPGERFGLPRAGVGSSAGAGARLLAFVVDLVVASLLTALFTRPDPQNLAQMQSYNLWAVAVWAATTALPVAFFGFTPGMAALGIRVARLDGGSMVGLWRAVVRAVLTFLIIPAIIRNEDNRTWLDRATNTIVIRMRGGG